MPFRYWSQGSGEVKSEGARSVGLKGKKPENGGQSPAGGTFPAQLPVTLSPSAAPSFDYADMPAPLGESENTITVLLRPAQGRGAPIR